MRKGLKTIIVGFVVALIGLFIPVLGLPLLLIGAVMMAWGSFQFWFGAGKKVVQGVGKAAGVEGSKEGTGKL